MEQTSLFDFLDPEQAAQFRPQKSDDWKWTFADYPKEKNGLKVFSCFACGGGSTMGYKLAGCDVIGCLEIDPKMNDIYVRNHHPKHNFLMDIREFNKIPNEELPPELFDLDILDGSPPCTTFSMAGDREESWGKKKKFREGQAEQTLDDLSFIFIDTVAKLKPKCVIMENVEGLLLGEAWSYVQRIYQQFRDCGYTARHWLLKGQHMGIPQKRHRVFFVAIRNDVDFDLARLNMAFNYDPVTFGEIKSAHGIPVSGEKLQLLTQNIERGDSDLSDVSGRMFNKPNSFFSYNIIYDDMVCNTITAKQGNLRYDTREYLSIDDVINAQTFPQDYDFLNKTITNVTFICGMSVPPVMIKRIVQRLIESGVFSYKEGLQ